MLSATHLTWSIAAAGAAGVVLRPWRLPEAVWAVAAAGALVGLGLLAPAAAATAVMRGADVYGFLAGMMLLSELARREGLFDAAAAWAIGHAAGSGRRLFDLVYVIGTGVTVLLSNDATAVVLTPAVAAACRRAGARALPHLMACALVANAASFVLPISNPANLVVFGRDLPALGTWLVRFGPPSIAAVAMTWAVLRWQHRDMLAAQIATRSESPSLGRSARVAAASIALAAVVLLACSALGVSLGAPTLAIAALAVAVVQVLRCEAPWALLRGVDWSILPLVAGLFVLVAGLESTGVVARLASALHDLEAGAPFQAAAWAGVIAAFGCNFVNNLPAGLLGGSVVAAAHAGAPVQAAIMIGIDLGPNLSVTGSLATILWLNAIRREGEHVSGARFLRIGAVAMPAALLAALTLALL